MIGNSSGIQLEQSQSVALNPAQLRTIEILQMSTSELQDKIEAELLENPVLEVASKSPAEDNLPSDKENDSSSIYEDDDEYDRYDRYDRYDTDSVPVRERRGESIIIGASRAAEFEKFYKTDETLREHLMMQLMCTKCSEAEREAAEYLIYSLNSDGYLDMDIEEIIEYSGCDSSAVLQAVEIVRKMHPSGIGAWTLEDCLILQLDKTDELYEYSCTVIRSMLHEVASRDIKKIERTLGISSETVRAIISNIIRLDPKPGARYSDGESVKYVIPDAEIEIISGKAVMHMTDVQPPLALNSYYCELAKTSTDKEVIEYLKDRINSANQLIDNIEQRKRTIEKVTLAILDRQRSFLEPGSKILEPLTMQQIADDLGVHVSTVSRAVRDKYIRFPTCTYPLKHFFTNEIGGVSRDNIYEEIRKIIDAEDPTKPLSDQKISDILMSDGIETSRRTVAKYRDAMGILPKSLRKKI